MSIRLIRLTAIAVTVAAFAQPAQGTVTLTEVAHPFPAISRGDLHWVDYDLDGELDLFVTGNDASGVFLTQLWHNQGGGNFVESGIALPGLWQSDADWKDFDGDGDPDLVLCGQPTGGGSLSRALRNEGSSFTDVGAPFVNTMDGAVAFLTVSPGDEYVALLGRDDPIADFYPFRAGVFEANSPGPYPALYNSDCASADIDGDGHQDFVYAGVLESAGEGVLQLQVLSPFGDIDSEFPGLTEAAITIGDYDADGDQDFAASGQLEDGTNVTRVYEFVPPDTFIQHDVGMGVWRGDLAWADVDSDGDLDLAYCGETSTATIAAVLERTPSGFIPGQTLAGARNASLAWGDWDADGDLDLIVTGREGDDVVRCRLYRNDHFLLNTPPTVPTGLSADAVVPAFELSWNASSDFETSVAGLTYNVRIGTTPGGNELLSGTATASGTRGLVRSGNVDHPDQLHVSIPTFGLETGLVYLSVQAIDGGFRHSAFAPEQTAFIPFTPVAQFSFRSGSLDLGDVDGDGIPEIFTAGFRQMSAEAVLFDAFDASPYAGTDSTFLGSFSGETRLGDVDNDGDLDAVIVTAITNSPSSARALGAPSHLLRNDGGTWAEIPAGLPTTSGGVGNVRFGDYDRDGDLDLAMSSFGLYRNDGGVFSATTEIPAAASGSVDWGDFDRDADLDLVLTGAFPAEETRVYRNDEGSFVNVATLSGSDTNAAAWLDHDSDGDLDVFVVDHTLPTRIWRNDGGAFVVDPTAISGTPNLSAYGLAPVDFDHDGDVDVVVGGYEPGLGAPGFFFRNEGGVMARVTTDDWPYLEGPVAIGDYDGDGGIDVASEGPIPNQQPIRAFHNNALVANTAPTTPGSLATAVVGDDLILTWSQAADGETPSAMLTYNVRVGTTPLGSEIASAQADPLSGARYVARPGNVGPSGFVVIDVSGVAEPTIYWTVQAIDGSFRGSPFAPVEEVALGATATTVTPHSEDELVVAPNPFRSEASIAFSIAREQSVTLDVFDVTGRRVRSLVSGPSAAGPHRLVWDARDDRGSRVANGVYWVRLRTESSKRESRLVLIR